MLHTWLDLESQPEPVPMRLEMKRMAPGATNSWFIEVMGTEGGIRFSTAEPKSVWTFRRAGKDQLWERSDIGFEMAHSTITGGIFEVGFPDIMQQMWMSYLLERAGRLGDRLGCVTPEEALQSHRIFAAALRSQAGQAVERVV